MPYSLEKWNETLRWRMQRGYEVELQDIKDGACSHRRFDGRQCDAKPGHGPWHAFDDMCELCDFKISAPSFAPGQECPNCGGVGRSRPWGVKSEARRMKERHERFGKHFGYQ